MEKIKLFLMVIIFFMSSICFADNKVMMVADFNSGEQPNNLGGAFGTWDYNPNDDTQSCSMSFVENDAVSTEGFALRLDYDVDSPNPAFNGFWMQLKDFNASDYDTLRLYVKGVLPKYTGKIKIELKTKSGKKAIYHIDNIDDNWQKVLIRFKNIKVVKDWSDLKEFTVVFSDIGVSEKEGAILLDNIAFVKSES